MKAILSVSDKTGLEELGRGLEGLGFQIYATGGTRRALAEAGVAAEAVSALTGMPEILEGRVKTMHPAVHAGLLARRDVAADMEELARHGLGAIDVVAVNLYPFEATVARRDATLDAALAQIDIGGPAMLRAAAKNFRAVLPLCDTADYGAALDALHRPDEVDPEFRRKLAAKAFRHVAVYDALIAAYLAESDSEWPEELALGLRKVETLRYGENPRQRAAFYATVEPGRVERVGIAGARQLQGKALSYTNLLDADAARAAVADLPAVAVAIVKHTNPCGLARCDEPLIAYELALAGDPMAAFGGVVGVNVPVDEALAHRLTARFYETVVAPGFTAEALEVLASRPDLRVLALPASGEATRPGLAWRSVSGGLLVQEVDRVDDGEVRQGRVVTRRAPSEEEWTALEFAWRAVRHVRSNAIVLAKGQAEGTASTPAHVALVGMGAGQPSRVAAVEIAVARAGARSVGAVLASDAFFPKADGVEAAAQAGVTAIVQPGGSVGDEETIAAAEAAGMAMVFTGTRHFLH